jgi:hypothetical protein
MERMVLLIRSRTSKLISAETAYQLALIVHEKAERSQARLEQERGAALRAEAVRLWENAVDSWKRYLDNYPELREYYKDRDRHARKLSDRARLLASEPTAPK